MINVATINTLRATPRSGDTAAVASTGEYFVWSDEVADDNGTTILNHGSGTAAAGWRKVGNLPSVSDGTVTTGKIADGAVTAAKLDVTAVAVGSIGTPQCYVFDIADAATDDYDVVCARAFEVTDVVVQKRGGAGGAANTVQVKETASVITDVMDINIADTTLARALTIDDAQSLIPAAGTLRVSVVKAGGNAACLVVVSGFVRA